MLYNDYLEVIITNSEAGTLEDAFSTTGTRMGTTYSSLIYSKYNLELKEGKYIMTAKYKKNSSKDSGLDSGYLKSATIFNYNDNGTETLTTHEYGGLVIYEGDEEINELNSWNESKNRNQFVWIPVKDINRIYESYNGKEKGKLWTFTESSRNQFNNPNTIGAGMLEPGLTYVDDLRMFSMYNLQGYTRNIFYKELQSEFDKAIASIKKYGGFYIGRYETGNIHLKEPVIRRLNTDLCYVSWYEAYLATKNISQNENIYTGIIWGSLFDETLQWIIETEDVDKEDIVSNGFYFGNYKNVGFRYTNTDELADVKKIYTEKLIPAGSSERNKYNNIYDLFGNAGDCTAEVHKVSSGYMGRRVVRGEALYSMIFRGDNIISREKYMDPYSGLSQSGFRAYLYIK